MTPLNLAELRSKAEAATPGPWRENIWTGPIEWHDGVKASIMAHAPMHLYIEGPNPMPMADSSFIAAANPAVVLELLHRLEGMEKALRAECFCTDESTHPSTCEPCIALQQFGEKS